MVHVPVLQKEVIEYLNPKPNENFIDCTISEGGHTAAILERITPRGRILGIDWDSEILKAAKFKIKNEKLKNNLILVQDNYANLQEIVKKYNFKPVCGILLDLGMSSWHLEKSGRGFSFQRREPLDMRYNPKNQLTAEKIINFWSKQELERILEEYGQERFAEKIAQKIIETRAIQAIKTTSRLVEIIREALPRRYWRQRIHFATRTFQALRIAVNDELNNLKRVLPQALEILEPEGRLVVISFHSLEDRIVKYFFNNNQSLKILTKKPITPSALEIKLNPRSRSAKLRAAIKT